MLRFGRGEAHMPTAGDEQEQAKGRAERRASSSYLRPAIATHSLRAALLASACRPAVSAENCTSV